MRHLARLAAELALALGVAGALPPPALPFLPGDAPACVDPGTPRIEPTAKADSCQVRRWPRRRTMAAAALRRR